MTISTFTPVCPSVCQTFNSIFILGQPQTNVVHEERRSQATYVHYGFMQGKADLCLKLCSLFKQLTSAGPRQLCTSAHLGYTCKVGIS